MSMVNEFDREKLLSDCEAVLNPEEGQLVVTGPVVCKTCAYYVGRWCGEYMADAIGAPPNESGKGGQWLFQPYSRETDYFATVQEAINVQGRMLADELECELSELGELLVG